MNIQLLGTSAAEGYPGIFCNCKACIKARQLGGKNIRTRSSAMIDDFFKIDLSADTLHHVLSYHLNLGDIEHLLFTHSHHDHFYPEELRMRLPVFAHEVNYPLNIYGNDKVISDCKDVLGPESDHFAFHKIEAFTPFPIGDFIITPLLADHDPAEACFIYHIAKENKQYLYGNDTGWFPAETWEWLEDKDLDLVTLDCTHGLIDSRSNHLNIEGVKDTKQIFAEKEIIHDATQVIATHFSHNIHLTHEELENHLQPHGIEVAYDGMKIEI